MSITDTDTIPTRRPRRHRLLALGIAAPLMLTPAAAISILTAAPASALACAGEGLTTVSRDHVMARADVWLTRHVPYNQGTCYGDPEYSGKSYREDCSGFVSMAWGLASSLVVSDFPRYATRLSSWQDMQPGDAMISPDGTSHMVLFAGWTNSQHTSFTVWHETKPGRGTAADPSGSWLNGYVAYRYNQITSVPSIEPVVNGGGTRMIGSGAYMDVSSAGQVYAWNSRYLGGSPGGTPAAHRRKVTAGDNGYWLSTSRADYTYGNAPYLGGGAPGHTSDIIALAATPTARATPCSPPPAGLRLRRRQLLRRNRGYSGEFAPTSKSPLRPRLLAADLRPADLRLRRRHLLRRQPHGFSKAIVAMSPTPDGRGYVMVSKNGQVYAYGDAG